jgi:tRNA1Val (adenine37-N6)-methyltransferase
LSEFDSLARGTFGNKRGHRTGTDDILCAWAAHSAAPEGAGRALELGAGQGAVSLMLTDQLPNVHITAVEAQVVSFELLERNVGENQLNERYALHCADLRQLSYEHGSFDLVFGTPPFMPLGSGTLPKDSQRAAARFEMRGGIETYCIAASQALRDGGGCAMVMDAARPERYEEALKSSGLSLERVTSVVPMAGSPPTYLVYEAKKGSAQDRGPERSEMAIRSSTNELSDPYRAMRVALELPTDRQLSP